MFRIIILTILVAVCTMTLDPEKLIGQQLPQSEYEFTPLNCMLYSLSIGFNEDPHDMKDMRFTYEKNPDFSVFPPMIGAHEIGKIGEIESLPGFHVPHRSNILHAESTTEIFKPIKVGQKFAVNMKVIDVADKKIGAIMCLQTDYVGEDGSIHATCINSCFLKDCGGFKYRGKMSRLVPNVKKDQANDVIIAKTLKNQALLFRLVGDDNPLHVDPEQSKAIGLDNPVLHGMCTYGVIMRALYQKYFNGNADLIKNTGIRFTSFVYPGETLEIHTYNLTSDGVQFEAKVQERDIVVAVGLIKMKMTAKL